MNIAIIGGGLTGLSAAYELLKAGHQVTVFEKASTLGGLAGGFTMPNWEWHLEYFYHHFFTNDRTLLELSKELGLEKEMLILRPVTATLTSCHSRVGGNPGFSFSDDIPDQVRDDTLKIFQLDSPMNLLTFPLLSPIDKLRTAALLAFCKLNPFWQPLEKITAKKFFTTYGGTPAWNVLWGPLMTGKFGTYADRIPASWLWARVHKRTTNLGYFRGGFRTFINALAQNIEHHGGHIILDSDITTINEKSDFRENTKKFIIFSSNLRSPTSSFDRILITTPSPTAIKLLSHLQPTTHNPQLSTYNLQLTTIPHLWAQTLILETKKPILDKTYWLNINDRSFPFIAVVAHTNMVDKKYYGGNHITYIGNYLPDGHPLLKMTKQELLKKFLPYLKQVNKQCNNVIIQQSHLFTSTNAQPVHTLNYSKKAPAIKTPIPGIYLANLDSIFPWDRGTNYAVELGQKAAQLIINM